MKGHRLYERVARELAQVIASGRYALGDRMPSERLLAEQFAVSRPTIREAMIALEVDGMVEVVTGSGVYVRALSPKTSVPATADIGPFELFEARAAIEGEAAAMAARNIGEADLALLEKLIGEMDAANKRTIPEAEDVDRQFHLTIARASNNSAVEMCVTMLWDARAASLQNVKFMEKVHAEGITPRIGEHWAILAALKSGDAEASRKAMRAHLRRVADMVFDATEAEAVERVKARLAGERRRFAALGQ